MSKILNQPFRYADSKIRIGFFAQRYVKLLRLQDNFLRHSERLAAHSSPEFLQSDFLLCALLRRLIPRLALLLARHKVGRKHDALNCLLRTGNITAYPVEIGKSSRISARANTLKQIIEFSFCTGFATPFIGKKPAESGCISISREILPMILGPLLHCDELRIGSQS
jgi:hypothetical protein